MLKDTCDVMNKKTEESVSVEEYIKFKKFEDFQVRSILTNKSDSANVLREFFKKYPHKTKTDLSKLNKFVRNQLLHHYFDGHCTEKNWICSRVDALCDNLEANLTLDCDENSEPKDRICPKIYTNKRVYIVTTSFPDWCNGRRFQYEDLQKSEYRLTTDSAFLRLMTFGTKHPSKLNKKIYYDLYDEFKNFSLGLSSEIEFYNFIDNQLQMFNTTASRILNQVCTDYKKSLDDKNSKSNEDEFESGLCPPTNTLAAYYCTLLEYPFPRFTKHLINGLSFGMHIF